MSDLIDRQAAIDALKPLPTIDGLGLQPLVTVDDAIKVLNNLPSVHPEDCDTCKHGYFGDEQCNSCRVRFTSHYERRTDEC